VCVSDPELNFYEECPNCHRRGKVNDVLESRQVPHPRIVKIYNNIAGKWNSFLWFICDLLEGRTYNPSYPKILRKIAFRRRFKLLLPDWFCKILPFLPYWHPPLWGYLILRCRHCGIELLTDDPRDFIHFQEPEGDDV